jgi:TetR/AcrR family transcriptional repressor of mexCD-oprJ operon
MAPQTTTKRRADAERSRAAIISAALHCFLDEPDVSMTDIARAADVSRVTLYAHFPSREELLTTVLDVVVSEAVAALDADHRPDLPARDALAHLLRSSWEILHRHDGLRTAVARALPEQQVREQHHRVVDRLQDLIARGQHEGGFRTDLPREWLATILLSLLHAAADEVTARRLNQNDVPDILEATVLSALAQPPS